MIYIIGKDQAKKYGTQRLPFDSGTLDFVAKHYDHLDLFIEYVSVALFNSTSIKNYLGELNFCLPVNLTDDVISEVRDNTKLVKDLYDIYCAN